MGVSASGDNDSITTIPGYLLNHPDDTRTRLVQCRAVERCLCTRKDNKRGRNLTGLTGAAQSRALAELLHALCGVICGTERSVYGSRHDGVDADTLGHEPLRKGLRDASGSSFGVAVKATVEEVEMMLEPFLYVWERARLR